MKPPCLLLAVLAAAPLQAAETASFKPDAFLSRYCTDCHDADVQKGDRRLDDLPLMIGTDLAAAERWQEVLHQLQLGEMPPAKKPQPSDEERRALLGWIEGQLSQAGKAAAARGGRVVHRRLNRAEYLHTVQDLFGFTGDFDPTTAFPTDEESESFRNNGAALRTSRHHLEQYLKAADAVLEHAYDLARVDGEPETRQWKDAAEEGAGLQGYHLAAFGLGAVRGEKANGPAYIHLSQGLRISQQIYDGKLFQSRLGEVGVPDSGWYEIDVQATAANRRHPYEKPPGRVLGLYDETRPMQLGIGRQVAGLKGNTWRLIPPHIVHAVELPDDRYVTVRARIWLDRGTVPYLSWIDGPPKGTRNHIIDELHKYDPSVQPPEKHVRESFDLTNERYSILQHLYRGPEIRLSEWQVRGPLRDDAPHPARGLLFAGIAPDEKRIDPARLQASLRDLAGRLFRRDVTSAELAPYLNALQKRLDGQTRYADAARPVFKALLCSPEFLFLTEPESAGKPLPPMQFASRLSYFLTAGPPDDTLRVLAEKGPLDAAAVRRETDRLLDSPRGDRFLRLFATQWLGLDALGTMPPAAETFPAYHYDRLEPAMKEETWRFVAELFRADRPVTALLDADFTYLTEGLARLYGLQQAFAQQRSRNPAEGAAMADEASVHLAGPSPVLLPAGLLRVSLPADSPRRGLLGHASILTVTSNGVETSPVKRGVWLLERVLGTPPSPPPPDVPPIEPDIRGATTIRQQLEKHRAVQACADCHAKIDPLGFALEAYDPIGRFRSTYPNGKAIDTSGEYRGQPVNSLADLRTHLVTHPELLAHNVAHRLLTYALGRPLGLADQSTLQHLQRDWKAKDYVLRELIHLITACEPLRLP
jgi:cytochrome c553